MILLKFYLDADNLKQISSFLWFSQRSACEKKVFFFI